MAALAVMALAMMAVSGPAMAGVGGCRFPGVGGCGPGGGQLTSSGPTTESYAVLDRLAGLFPTDMIVFARLALDGTIRTSAPQQTPETADPTIQGVGGCRMPGVGGCKL